MNITKQPFLLEVWQDVWNVAGGYWDEVKGPMLGSNEMDYLGKAYDIVLTKDMFGSVKLTFSIEGLYYNPITGVKESNYLVDYLFNETKIKLFYKNEWYDFIIKKIDESKDNKLSIKYDCEYLPIHELSKTGRSVIFSIENDNTVQNADDFMTDIMAENDWTYVRAGTAGSAVANLSVDLSEYVEEVLYQLDVNPTSYDLYPITVSSDGQTMEVGVTAITVNAVDIIYIPESQLGLTGNIQVIYVDGTYTYDKNGCVTNSGSLYELRLGAGSLTGLSPTIYRGKKLKNTPLSEYINYVDNDNHKNDIAEVCLKYLYNGITYYSHQINIIDDNSVTYTANTAAKPNPDKTYYLFSLDEESGGHYYPYYKLTNWLSGTTYGDYFLVKDNTNFTGNLEVEIYPTLEYFTITRNVTTGVIETLTRIPASNTTLIGHISSEALYSIEKYRTFEAKNSNRFNLTQDIAELFEVWCKYIIVHEDDGRIALDPITHIPKKYVTLVSNYGVENQAGFVYGLNIDSIQRSVDSNQLATKLYVDNAENQAAVDGIVTIQYSSENLAKENFLLNFNYFTRSVHGHGALLDATTLLNDLYKIQGDGWDGHVGSTGAPGYLRHLGILNNQYDTIWQLIGFGQTGLYWKLADAKEKAATYEIASKTSGTGLSNDDDLAWTHYKNLVIEIETKLDGYNQDLKDIKEDKILLHQNFAKKYSRFIQEGSWQDNNYTSHNTYYYDALKVLNEAAFPKISYTIKVADISSIIDINTNTDYSDYAYEEGNITSIQDTEYFGYDGHNAPYKELVIVSEIQYHLDKPMEDEIKIQNYYTQFEDLFQRLNATVQSYDFNKNTYARAGIFSPDGTIAYMSLQDSFTKNQQLTLTSNEIVKYDDKGITLTNAYNPNLITRLVSGGIVLSDDGGVTWDTGIYAGEINTRLLSAGQINAENIKIISTGSTGAITMDGSIFKMVSVCAGGYTETIDPDPINGKVYYTRSGTSPNHVYTSQNTTQGFIGGTTYYEPSTSVFNNSIQISPSGITMKQGNNEVFSVTASTATIAGWSFNTTSLYTGTNSAAVAPTLYLGTENILKPTVIAGSESKTDWRVKIGSFFGIDDEGYLYATGAKLSGEITATGGRIDGTLDLGTNGAIRFGNTNYFINQSGIHLRDFDSNIEDTGGENNTYLTPYNITITDGYRTTYGAIFGGDNGVGIPALWIEGTHVVKIHSSTNVSIDGTNYYDNQYIFRQGTVYIGNDTSSRIVLGDDADAGITINRTTGTISIYGAMIGPIGNRPTTGLQNGQIYFAI